MIRIVLLGRTGNNLFQYALGRVLAEKHDVPLVMDASWYNAAGWAEVSHFLRLPLKARVSRLFPLGSRALRNLTGKHHWEYCGVPILKESTADQSFDARFRDAPADCMLFGYFQSPIYFESIADDLRAEINHLLARTHPLRPVAQQLAEPNSIAVHVRRGDYLRIPAFHVCGETYHRQSMNLMRARLPDARFFIFSDDPGWCRENFRDSDMEVIDSGSAASNPLHDLHLMSLASHHIIANSTYSWWAAWLGKKPDQQVIMPDRWYADGPVAPINEKRLSHWRIIPTAETQPL
jgi:hypothetical protein